MLRSSSSAFYSPDTIIIILSPPPICAPQRREDVRNRWGEVELDRTPERTKEFARAAEEVAKELNVGFVPVFDAIMTAAGPDPDVGLQRYFTDGLHLTASGYQVMCFQHKDWRVSTGASLILVLYRLFILPL